jgi:Fur family ferric uptake transcriptional regulator
MNDDKLAEALKNHDQSVTKARRLVFEALGAQESQTMRELINRLAGQVDRASIYRTVELFEKIRIVEKIQIGWKYKLELSNAFSYHHHHLTCGNCGRDVPIHENSALEQAVQTFLMAHGFVRSTHQVQIRGLCQSCQAQGLDTKGLSAK